jgi:hypothetical protein
LIRADTLFFQVEASFLHVLESAKARVEDASNCISSGDTLKKALNFRDRACGRLESSSGSGG